MSCHNTTASARERARCGFAGKSFVQAVFAVADGKNGVMLNMLTIHIGTWISRGHPAKDYPGSMPVNDCDRRGYGRRSAPRFAGIRQPPRRSRWDCQHESNRTISDELCG